MASILRLCSTVQLGQEEYQKRYDALCARFDALKGKLDGATGQIAEKTLRRDTVEYFLHDLMKQPSLVTEFDPMVWHTMVEGVTVISWESARFTFRDGTERTA